MFCNEHSIKGLYYTYQIHYNVIVISLVISYSSVRHPVTRFIINNHGLYYLSFFIFTSLNIFFSLWFNYNYDPNICKKVFFEQTLGSDFIVSLHGISEAIGNWVLCPKDKCCKYTFSYFRFILFIIRNNKYHY